MMMGQCLCGGVAVRLPTPESEVGVCHCVTCRRWGSGSGMAVQAPGAGISGESLTVYSSSRFAERGTAATAALIYFIDHETDRNLQYRQAFSMQETCTSPASYSTTRSRHFTSSSRRARSEPQPAWRVNGSHAFFGAVFFACLVVQSEHRASVLTGSTAEWRVLARDGQSRVSALR